MAIDGRNRRRISSESQELHVDKGTYAWSPDSRQIAYLRTPTYSEGKSTRRADREDASLRHKSSVVVYASPSDIPPPSEVWLTTIDNDGSDNKLSSFDGMLFGLSWFPDGKHLLVYGFRQGNMYRSHDDNSELLTIAANNGEQRPLVVGGGEEMLASASPNGKQVALL